MCKASRTRHAWTFWRNDAGKWLSIYNIQYLRTNVDCLNTPTSWPFDASLLWSACTVSRDIGNSFPRNYQMLTLVCRNIASPSTVISIFMLPLGQVRHGSPGSSSWVNYGEMASAEEFHLGLVRLVRNRQSEQLYENHTVSIRSWRWLVWK